MIIHTVFFWHKAGVSEAEKAAFIEGAKKLGTVSTVKAIHVGTPAGTPRREVVDHSFDVNLVLHFDNIALHDAYQVDPIHHEFIDLYKHLWARVQVYDSATA